MLGFPWLVPFRLSRGTPVAVLILVRPSVEVNAIECDSLRADGNHRDVRAHVTVEAVLVHAEILRSVAQADEARRGFNRRSQGLHLRPCELCGSGRLGTSCHSMSIL